MSYRTAKGAAAVSFSGVLIVSVSSCCCSKGTSCSRFSKSNRLADTIGCIADSIRGAVCGMDKRKRTRLSSAIASLVDGGGCALARLGLLVTNSVPSSYSLLLVGTPAGSLSRGRIALLAGCLTTNKGIVYLLKSASLASFPGLTDILGICKVRNTSNCVTSPAEYCRGRPCCVFPRLGMSNSLTGKVDSRVILLAGTRKVALASPAQSAVAADTFVRASRGKCTMARSRRGRKACRLKVITARAVSSKSSSRRDDAARTHLAIVSTKDLVSRGVASTFSRLRGTRVFVGTMDTGFSKIRGLSVRTGDLKARCGAVRRTNLFDLLMVFKVPTIVLVTKFDM